MALKAPISHIQHFLTLFDDIGASAALVQDPEHPQTLFVAKSPMEAVVWAKKFLSVNEWSQVSTSACRDGEQNNQAESPTRSRDDSIGIGTTHPVQTRVLRRGRDSSESDDSDSDVLDPLQNEPEPKRRRILHTEYGTRRGLSECQVSRRVINDRRHQNPMSCTSTDDESHEGTSKSEFSGTDEDDESLAVAECESRSATPSPLTSPSPGTPRSTSAETCTSIASPSRNSSPSQSEPDYPRELQEEAKAAPLKHRSAIIRQSLALGTRTTLENLRAACVYWRAHISKDSQVLTLNRPVVRHGSAYTLDQFSQAYHLAQTTRIHRTVLDILYRVDLAHVYDVYLGTLSAFSGYTVQEEKISSSRQREVFHDHARSAALDQMYWACYPKEQGKPRSDNRVLARKFATTLEYAAKWHALRKRFGIGMLALVPRGANSSFTKLPFEDLPVYFRVIAAANPTAVNMAKVIDEWIFCFWQREELPKQLLALESVEVVDTTFSNIVASSLQEPVKEEVSSLLQGSVGEQPYKSHLGRGRG